MFRSELTAVRWNTAVIIDRHVITESRTDPTSAAVGSWKVIPWKTKEHSQLIRTHSERAKIPRNNLKRRFVHYLETGKLKKAENRGRRPFLTQYEEKKLREWVKWCQKRHLTPSSFELRLRALDIVKKRTLGFPVAPGHSWATDFAKRHKLSLRKTRTREQNRAGLKARSVAHFFWEIEHAEAECKASAWLNSDEAGWHGYYEQCKDIKVMVCDEVREEAYRTMSNCREHITMLPIVGIDVRDPQRHRHLLGPTMFTFPAARLNTRHGTSQLDPNLQDDQMEDIKVLTAPREVLQDIQRGYPIAPKNAKGGKHRYKPRSLENTIFSAAKSGNVNSDIIQNWAKELVSWLRKEGFKKDERVNMIFDAHASHVNKEVVTYLKSEGVRIFYLPGHSSHILQPCDVVLYVLLKGASKTCINAWYAFLYKYGTDLHICDFPYVTQYAFRSVFTSTNIIESFKRPGISPFNPDVVLSQFPQEDGSPFTYAEFKERYASTWLLARKAAEADASGQVDSAEVDDLFVDEPLNDAGQNADDLFVDEPLNDVGQNADDLLVDEPMNGAGRSESQDSPLSLCSKTMSEVGANRMSKLQRHPRCKQYPNIMVYNNEDKLVPKEWKAELNIRCALYRARTKKIHNRISTRALAPAGAVMRAEVSIHFPSLIDRSTFRIYHLSAFVSQDVFAQARRREIRVKHEENVKRLLKEQKEKEIEKKKQECKELTLRIKALKKTMATKTKEFIKEDAKAAKQFSSSSRPKNEYQFCICRTKMAREKMVKCSGPKFQVPLIDCPGNGRFHFECMGLNEDYAPSKDEPYLCPYCERRAEMPKKRKRRKKQIESKEVKAQSSRDP